MTQYAVVMWELLNHTALMIIQFELQLGVVCFLLTRWENAPTPWWRENLRRPHRLNKYVHGAQLKTKLAFSWLFHPTAMITRFVCTTPHTHTRTHMHAHININVTQRYKQTHAHTHIHTHTQLAAKTFMELSTLRVFMGAICEVKFITVSNGRNYFSANN